MLRKTFMMLLIAMPLSVVGQGAGNTDLKSVGDDRGFVVDVTGPPVGVTAYSDAVNVTVRVRATEDTSFADISIAPIGDLNEVYPPVNGVPNRTCSVDGTGVVRKGGTLVAHCEVAFKGQWRQRLLGPSIWIRPGIQRLMIHLPVVRSGNSVTYLEEVGVTFQAPLIAVFLGGLTGAFLLALFAAVRERAESPLRPLEISSLRTLSQALAQLVGWMVNLIPRLWRMVLQTVVGGICALVLILLAQATDGMNPPISIKVQDFWGGVVVGLFSIPISKWIWLRLQSGEADGGQHGSDGATKI